MKRTALQRKTPMKRSRIAPTQFKRATVANKGKLAKYKSLKYYKDKLWAITRQIVFLTYGRDCYTCHQKDLQGSNCQGGHVPWPGSTLSAECKHDIRFIRAQCYNCNINRGGMGAVALERMQKEKIDTEALKAYNRQTTGLQYDRIWYQQKIEEYTSLLKDLITKNNP